MGGKKSWASAFKGLFIEEAGNTAGGGDAELDIEALLRETQAITDDAGLPPPIEPSPSAPAVPSAPSAPSASAPVPSGLEIGQPLVELYKAYDLPRSPKPIEEIILFIQGLKSMPHNVQAQALKAMDDANPQWSIADVLLDGRYKVDALKKAKAAVDAQVQDARLEVDAEITAQDGYLADAQGKIKEQIETLHAQIAELMELQAAEQEQVEARKSAAHDRIRALEGAALAEHQRLETEIARITQVVTAFGPLAEEP